MIAGLGGDDTLSGEGGDDVLCGGPGDDVLTAGTGADRLRGGRGDDEVSDIVVDSADQELVGGPGDDTLAFGWQVDEDGEAVPFTVLTDLPAGVTVLGETGVSFPTRSFRSVRTRFSSGTWAVVGTDADEVFTAHQYMAVDARTGRGRDVVHGSWHDDTIRGGPGRDTAYASRGGTPAARSSAGRWGSAKTAPERGSCRLIGRLRDRLSDVPVSRWTVTRTEFLLPNCGSSVRRDVGGAWIEPP